MLHLPLPHRLINVFNLSVTISFPFLLIIPYSKTHGEAGSFVLRPVLELDRQDFAFPQAVVLKVILELLEAAFLLRPELQVVLGKADELADMPLQPAPTFFNTDNLEFVGVEMLKLQEVVGALEDI
jgi:hypothetical protein